jgi:hypothetical protein
LERWLSFRRARDEAVQTALKSGEVPVRGKSCHRGVIITSVIPERIEKRITSDMHIDVDSSAISSERWRHLLWTEVEVKWQPLLIYCQENLLPQGTARTGYRGQSGRKTNKETRRPEILRAFEQMQIVGKHGELTAIAKKLQKKFSAYELGSIRKIIQPTYHDKIAKLKKDG